MFHRARRAADPRWEVAASIQVFAADRELVNELVVDLDVDGETRGPALDGVLVARSHPTGWFLWALRRDDLAGQDLEHFRELVTVRAYLLLCRGPEAPLWTRGPGPGEWRSVAPSPAAELAGIARELGG